MAVCPLDRNDSTETYLCDIECTEADIQSIDNCPHAFDDFVEKFIKAPMHLIVDRFQQPYGDVNDYVAKTTGIGRTYLPRSIDFYRQQIEIDKATRVKA